MGKGKIALIVTSVILALALAVAAVFIGLNWSKLKSAIVDKTQLYTYEQLEAAKKEGYDEAGFNKTAYEKQLKEFAGEVARLEEKLKSFQSKLNELLQEKYNQGYNAGYDEGLANGTVNVPEGSFALIFAPNIPLNCSSNIKGKMTSSVNSCSATLVVPSCDYSLKGYIFQGWNTKADGTGTAYSVGATVAANSIESGAILTLYAQWQPYSLAGRAYSLAGTAFSVDTYTSYSGDYSVTLASSLDEFVGIYFRDDSIAYYGKLRLSYGRLILLQVNELNFDKIPYSFKNDILSWKLSNEVSTFSFNEETDCLCKSGEEFVRIDGINEVLEAPHPPTIRIEGDTVYVSNIEVAPYDSYYSYLNFSFYCEGCDPSGFEIDLSSTNSTSYVCSIFEIAPYTTLSGNRCEIFAFISWRQPKGFIYSSLNSNSVFYTFN